MIDGAVNVACEAVVTLPLQGPEGRTRDIQAVIATGYTGTFRRVGHPGRCDRWGRRPSGSPTLSYGPTAPAWKGVVRLYESLGQDTPLW